MTPIDNKYTRHYWKLINTRKNKITTGYTEKHHIIPKSLGGTNLKDNLVSLTPREHFIAHLLLSKMFEGDEKYKMYYAFNMILVKGTENQRYKPTSRFYEQAKKLVGVTSSKNNKGRVPWNKGIPRTQEVKDAVSNANTGKEPWNRGIPRPDYVKEAVRTARLGKPPGNKGLKEIDIKCEHCFKMIAGKGNFIRWHGDNCKMKGKNEV
jgi:hypothetical protein